MVNVVIKRCSTVGCMKRRTHYGKGSTEALLCRHHTDVGMVNIFGRRCKVTIRVPKEARGNIGGRPKDKRARHDSSQVLTAVAVKHPPASRTKAEIQVNLGVKRFGRTSITSTLARCCPASILRTTDMFLTSRAITSLQIQEHVVGLLDKRHLEQQQQQLDQEQRRFLQQQ